MKRLPMPVRCLIEQLLEMTDEAHTAAALAALGHTLRLRLWRFLLPYGPAGVPAGIIAVRLSVLPSSLSFHLRQMTQAGVLVQRRSSRQIIYAVNFDIIQQLEALFRALTPNGGSESGQVDDLVGDG